jgi:hypothetical protein
MIVGGTGTCLSRPHKAVPNLAGACAMFSDRAADPRVRRRPAERPRRSRQVDDETRAGADECTCTSLAGMLRFVGRHRPVEASSPQSLPRGGGALISRSIHSGPTSRRFPAAADQATRCSRSSLRCRSPVVEPRALRPRIACTHVTMCPMLQRAASSEACLSSPGVALAMNSISTVSADAASMIRWQRRSSVSIVGSFDDATVRTTPLSYSCALPS